MHTLTLYTQPSFISRENDDYCVKVLFKAEQDPNLADLPPSNVRDSPGVITIKIPYLFKEDSEYLNNQLLAEAEILAASVAVSSKSINAFNVKKGPQLTSLEVRYSQELSFYLATEKNTPAELGVNISLKQASVLTHAFLLGATYTHDKPEPSWLSDVVYTSYQTDQDEIKRQQAVEIDGVYFLPIKRAVIGYLALPMVQKNNITRPYIAFCNHLKKAAGDGNFSAANKQLKNDIIDSRIRTMYYANGVKMIMSYHKDDPNQIETIIETQPAYSEDTYKEYEGLYEVNLARLNQLYRNS
ncbi:hypothetical protein H2O73_19700 [Vibrio sp. 404]|uniref:Uncharacterized protein n=1 Tax=Vibrio marinisediminis TaxID=2758441 RepID=A0A7W2IVP0_9VIBR|nr:hypothetical protein [Vibrio marinisediminis]MBA5764588.1 hypothetical protein [Vibrio marinisediminis]